MLPLITSTSAERSTLHVSGISKGTAQDDLQVVFGKYNPVEIRIMGEVNPIHWKSSRSISRKVAPDPSGSGSSGTFGFVFD
jgi:hypothetical protein